MLENKIYKIQEFYKKAMEENKFSETFVKELKAISNQDELKKFIKEKVCSIAESMGYDFTVDDILEYELETAKQLNEEELELISGGAGIKNWILGGMISLFTLGGGVLLSGTAHAELNSEQVAESFAVETTALEKPVKVQKPQEKSAVEEKKHTDEKSEGSQKIKKEDTKNPQDQSETKSGEGSSKIEKNGDDTLKFMKESSGEKPIEKSVEESRTLTDDQKLYAMKALNLQDAYALLQSGVIENMRLYGNISKTDIDAKTGRRLYTADHGDAFTELLYMLYPSNAGTLNIFGGGDRPNFSKIGGISPELMAKFCSVLNDYRNEELVDIPANCANISDKKFTDLINWLEAKGFDTNEYKIKKENCEKAKKIRDILKKYNDIAEDIKNLNNIDEKIGTIKTYIDFQVKINEINANLSEASKELEQAKKQKNFCEELSKKLNTLKSEKIINEKQLKEKISDPVIKMYTKYVDSKSVKADSKESIKADLMKGIKGSFEELKGFEETYDAEISGIKSKINTILKKDNFSKIFSAVIGKLNNENEKTALNSSQKKILEYCVQTQEKDKSFRLGTVADFKAYIDGKVSTGDEACKNIQSKVNELSEENFEKIKSFFANEVNFKDIKDLDDKKFILSLFIMGLAVNSEEDLKKDINDILNAEAKFEMTTEGKINEISGNYSKKIQLLSSLIFDEKSRELNEASRKPIYWISFINMLKDAVNLETGVLDKNIKGLEAKIQSIGKELKGMEEEKSNDKLRKRKQNQLWLLNEKLKKLQSLSKDDSYKAYPEYLVEHILMSYMIKMLDTKEQVEQLYQEITTQLSKNKSSTIVSDDKIKEKIESEKARIEKLNKLINAAEIQHLSPYKSKTQSNNNTYSIGDIIEGKVKFSQNTFQDCADITVRHIVNLLSYSNNKNWDLLLPKEGEELESIKKKLKAVVDAIKGKKGEETVLREVEFYSLKDRLQMFFLYQSEKGADIVSDEARTLWEYAICNMDEKNLASGVDKDQNYFSIKYRNKNYELKPGYINMLKLMWNIASALDLGQEKANDDEISKFTEMTEQKVDDKNSKLALSKEYINFLYGKTASRQVEIECLVNAMKSTFALFHPKDTVDIPTRGIQSRNIKSEDSEITTGDKKIMVTVEKENDRLSFDILQYEGHAEANHNPVIVKSKVINEFVNYDGDDNFFRILLRNLSGGYGKIKIPFEASLLNVYSGDKLEAEDQFKNMDLYKKYKALFAFRRLQGEENNYGRIMAEVTTEAIKGAEKIQISKSENLGKLFHERYLNPNSYKFYDVYFKDLCIAEEELFGKITELYLDPSHEKKIDGLLAIKTSHDNNEVRLIIEDLTDLVIPSTVYDKNGNLYRVCSWGRDMIVEKIVDKKGTRVRKETKKWDKLERVTFLGDFDDLKITIELFRGANKLKEVKFSGTFKKLTIGNCAFSGCENLTFNLEAYDQLEELEIGISAFFGNGLKEFKIPKNVKNLVIGNRAFKRCKCLTTFNLDNCDQLEKLLIGVGAGSEKGVFSESGLKEFKIPQNVKNLEINEEAFSYCKNLTTFNLDACDQLKELKIGDYAFRESGLKAFIIPESVETFELKKDTFYDFKGVAYIPQKFMEICTEAGVKSSLVYYANAADLSEKRLQRKKSSTEQSG